MHRHGQEREEIESFDRRTSCKHNMRQVIFLKIITVCRATRWPMSCNEGIDAYFPRLANVLFDLIDDRF